MSHVKNPILFLMIWPNNKKASEKPKQKTPILQKHATTAQYRTKIQQFQL